MTDATDGESTWDRLRRRKVVQWGIAYAAGAWGFLQGLAYVSELLEWPAQLQKLTGLALLTGLPIALVLAWYHGDRGERRVTRTELAILTLLFLLGGGLFWRYQHTTESPTPTAATEPATSGVPAAAAAGPSIAVLPFDNRSAKQDDAYFVDGIHDDILTQLSKISALKVISRTSVEQFRDTKLPIKNIAEQLGVKSILEGGVQRAGERVRINVQLIDASTDAHLWAETYDRELTAENIFAIQAELAVAIAGALKTTLTPAEQARATVVPTRDLEAWEAYQLGKQRMAKRTSGGLNEAETFFHQAIELDPRFALAWAGLAQALVLQIDYGGKPQKIPLAAAETAAATAFELDPNLAEAWLARGLVTLFRDELESAQQLFRRAIELDPNNAWAEQLLSLVLRDEGRLDEYLEHAERAVRLDPLSAHLNSALGDALERSGRFDEAAARYRRAIEIDPTSPTAYSDLAWLSSYARNRFRDAVPLQERALSLDPGNPKMPVGLALLRLDLNDEAQATQLIAGTLRRWTDSLDANVGAAMLAATLGEPSAAERHANKALTEYARESYSLAVLRNADLGRSAQGKARSRYASAFPELLAPTAPPINAANLFAAIDLALVLQRTGEQDRAAALLDASERVIRSMPRLGFSGYGIADVQIHALRGDKAKALAALREASTAGWRGPAWRYYRDVDPNLASIREDPEFKAVFADIERDMARQRAELAARPKDAPLDPASR